MAAVDCVGTESGFAEMAELGTNGGFVVVSLDGYFIEGSPFTVDHAIVNPSQLFFETCII